jgi:SHS2 domain-containing protein
VRLKVVGETLKDLFSQASLGMAEILKKGYCSSENFSLGNKENLIKKEISITAPRTVVLLVDFLSEILTFCYEEKTVFCKVDFEKVSEDEVRARILGGRVGGFDEDIKAVTYHEMEITETDKGFETTILFDI